ncbi:MULTISPECIES: hypothetical protein [Enterobacteriaceae]|uniref:hypothetical protein n=1 Tax=Enterobacteriaceae TaxID=543 RepID=UPI0009BE151A|nr:MULTISPECIES: hypothetical protein [Enterobacteriaceae]DAP14657.1 MAG TPA: hypothetical protein [Caudoviricetes sp.]HBY0608540.1 hypothetical protein [Klebsiella pneumoniae subsp. pneumoniae]EFA4615233.1 hypothetical protein [Escherichia coli]EFM0421367.1 hypothetical protein [Escherichia coli]EGI4416770.1 hypothetical protein [Escherichia coli]
MIIITTKDGTQLSGEVKDLVILLENDGKKVSDYLQPMGQQAVIRWYVIFIPTLIYFIINIAYITSQTLIPEEYSRTVISLFLFIGFILSAIISYFVHQKHKSNILSLCCLLFLILVVGANVGYISYSELTQKATQKLDSLLK